eukprot:6213058-Pleurochrysis_carterae.AAC.2
MIKKCRRDSSHAAGELCCVVLLVLSEMRTLKRGRCACSLVVQHASNVHTIYLLRLTGILLAPPAFCVACRPKEAFAPSRKRAILVSFPSKLPCPLLQPPLSLWPETTRLLARLSRAAETPSVHRGPFERPAREAKTHVGATTGSSLDKCEAVEAERAEDGDAVDDEDPRHHHHRHWRRRQRRRHDGERVHPDRHERRARVHGHLELALRGDGTARRRDRHLHARVTKQRDANMGRKWTCPISKVHRAARDGVRMIRARRNVTCRRDRTSTHACLKTVIQSVL